MKSICLLAVLAPLVTPALGQRAGFEADAPGSVPAGWSCGVTGRGEPHWVVEVAADAPSPTHVLAQRGRGDFPWCVRSGTFVADGFVEVDFKALDGREDQAAGVVWRWQDGQRYYVARANALENNVSLYYTDGGRRHTLKYVDAPVAPKAWHRLRVDFQGRHIRVSLDGKRYIDFDDDNIKGPGAVGVWTKEDSVTAFDDFNFGSSGERR
jgi:hypothetical protein